MSQARILLMLSLLAATCSCTEHPARCAGERKLEALLEAPDGESWGHYYVYIEPSDSPR